MSVPHGSVQGVAKPVSRLVLGTMIINSKEQERSSALLDAAFAHGINTVDTAFVYGGGFSEMGIGNWMAARGNREQVVVLSKGAHPGGGRKRVTKDDIAADLKTSLERLQTTYIDIYMLHRDDPDVPAGQVVEWLNEHLAAGRIKSFGGSNWRHERLQAANEYAKEHKLVPFAASSPHFSLAEQVENPWGEGCVTVTGEKEGAARVWYRRTKLPLFAYSSLARGLFSGRVTPQNYKEAADGACQKAYCHPGNFERLARATQLAKERSASVTQVALAFVLQYPLNLYPLVGAANEDEIKANIAAVKLKLTGKEMAWLNLESDKR